MAVINVTYANGDKDQFPAEGGETGALAQELAADPEVLEYRVDYDA
jgi:hypothetical protein